MPKITSKAIRAELAETTLAMNKAREDAALFERLRAAGTEASRLAKRADELTGALSKAEADEAKAEREALFAKYGGITVTASEKSVGSGTIGATWTITYKRLSYASHLNTSVMVERSCVGFEALDPDTFRYLIEKHPQQIPEAIKALAPGDIDAAFHRYFVARKRGYLSAN